jgi:hypothetical protein
VNKIDKSFQKIHFLANISGGKNVYKVVQLSLLLSEWTGGGSMAWRKTLLATALLLLCLLASRAQAQAFNRALLIGPATISFRRFPPRPPRTTTSRRGLGAQRRRDEHGYLDHAAQRRGHPTRWKPWC